jgi:hypothetical protein
MELFLLWVICTGATSVVAAYKGRSGFGWLILGALFGIFALLVVAILPNLNVERAEAAAAAAAAIAAPTGPLKVCPMCAETVKAAALKCRFCGHDFPRQDEPMPANAPLVVALEASRLEKKPCADCGTLRRVDASACPHCGAPA